MNRLFMNMGFEITSMFGSNIIQELFRRRRTRYGHILHIIINDILSNDKIYLKTKKTRYIWGKNAVLSNNYCNNK